MPRISFCFQGWVSGADIETVFDIEAGTDVNVKHLDAEIVIERLEKGECALSFDDALKNCGSSEVEIHDYEETLG